MPYYPPAVPVCSVLVSDANKQVSATVAYQAVVTKTLAAGQMATNGDSLHLTYIADQANTNSCSYQITLGGSAVATHAAQVTAGTYEIRATITRLTATTGRISYHLFYPSNAHYQPVTSALALTWANAQTLNFNLACATATTDATLYQATAIYVPAVP